MIEIVLGYFQEFLGMPRYIYCIAFQFVTQIPCVFQQYMHGLDLKDELKQEHTFLLFFDELKIDENQAVAQNISLLSLANQSAALSQQVVAHCLETFALP